MGAKGYQGPPQRYAVVAACFLATFSVYCERVGFSIAYTPVAEQSGASEALKGAVLSAFYYGYATSQIPGGWAASIYGSKAVMAAGFLGWAGTTLLIPVFLANPTVLSVARTAVGCAQGLVIPSVHTALAAWVPPQEKSRAVSLSTSGMYLGSALAMLTLPTVVAKYGSDHLLQGVGAVGLCWLMLWMRIPEKPKEYDLSAPTSPAKRRAPVPWKALVTCRAVWAISVNNFTFHYVLYMLMNWLPTFYKSLLGVQLSRVGLTKALPYLCMFCFSNLGGIAGDYLVNQKNVQIRHARVLVNTVGFIATAVAVVCMPYARTPGEATFYLTATLSSLGLARGGFSVNHMDVAPKYAGIVMGMSNTCGTIAGIIGVTCTGVLLERAGGATELSGWVAATQLCAVLLLSGVAIFWAYAQGHPLFK